MERNLTCTESDKVGGKHQGDEEDNGEYDVGNVRPIPLAQTNVPHLSSQLPDSIYPQSGRTPTGLPPFAPLPPFPRPQLVATAITSPLSNALQSIYGIVRDVRAKHTSANEALLQLG